MIDAVRGYLHLFCEDTPAEERSMERLAKALDNLLVAYHETVNCTPESDITPPKVDCQKTYLLMRRRFPDFGLYASVAPGEDVDGSVVTGDAVDDLADIYGDLRGVAWLWENSGEADAVWHFRFGYETHWGRHLLDLRSYLHWKLCQS